MAMLFAPAYMGGDLRRQIKKWPSPFPGNRLARLARLATDINGRARVPRTMPRKEQTMTTSHAPGDRVRIQHDPARDPAYSPEHQRARRALAGQIGSVRERRPDGLRRVVAPGPALEGGAWFAGDELRPIVTDPDGFEVGAPAQVAACCLCGKAREEVPHLVANEAGRAVCDECIAQASAMLKAEQPRPALPSPQDALASLAAVVAERDALRARLVAASAAWASCRAWLLSLPRPLGADGLAAVDAVDAALGASVARSEQKIAGPWTRSTVSGVWYRCEKGNRDRDVARMFDTEWTDAGWQAFPHSDAAHRGPETGDAGKAAVDRALLAAGWTLEGAPAPVDDAQALRTACEAVTGSQGLPAGELAARVLAGVQRAGEAPAAKGRARLHEGDPAAAKP